MPKRRFRRSITGSRRRRSVGSNARFRPISRSRTGRARSTSSRFPSLGSRWRTPQFVRAARYVNQQRNNPRPHVPIHAFAKFRHIRFKYVTTVTLPASGLTGGMVRYAFHPDFVNKPDSITALASTLPSSTSVSHQPHAFDFWQAIYQHVVVKSCHIRVDRVALDTAIPKGGLCGVKLVNQHQYDEIGAVSTNSASTPRSATTAGTADRLIETSTINGGVHFPSAARRGRLTQHAHWSFRRWNGPRKSLTEAYTLSSWEVYKSPFASTIAGVDGAEYYNQPVFMVYLMGGDGSNDAGAQHVRCTLWYDVIMKLGDNPNLPSGLA